jgi:hypothetical protein
MGIGDKDDYAVVDGKRVIGRIFLHPQAPTAEPWVWTITAREQPSSLYNRGYCAFARTSDGGIQGALVELTNATFAVGLPRNGWPRSSIVSR